MTFDIVDGIAIVIDCDDIDGDVVVPEWIHSDDGDVHVTAVGEDAFEDCTDITSVTLPESITSIGRCAFRGCSGLESVNIPSDVVSIGEWAFYGCRGLITVDLPDGITAIEDGTFAGCNGLRSIDIPDNVTSIGEDALNGCSGIVSVRLPDSVTSIGDTAFSRCSGLEYVNIPKNVTSIGMGAFNSCPALHTMEVDGDNGQYSFRDGMLLSKDCTVLYKCLIHETEEFTIPSGIESIEDYAFLDCRMLRSVRIPESVKHVGKNAFHGCPLI